MGQFGIAAALLATLALLGGCSAGNQSNVSTSSKTFNPKLVLTMSSFGAPADSGTVILQNEGIQTAMDLTLTAAAGGHGVAEFLYVRTVRVGSRESWITQSASEPLNLPGGEGVLVSFPNGLSFPIRATWTQVNLSGNPSTVSSYIQN